MSPVAHTFTSALWRWPAQEAWRFVTVPAKVAEQLRITAGPPRVRLGACRGHRQRETSV